MGSSSTERARELLRHAWEVLNRPIPGTRRISFRGRGRVVRLWRRLARLADRSTSGRRIWLVAGAPALLLVVLLAIHWRSAALRRGEGLVDESPRLVRCLKFRPPPRPAPPRDIPRPATQKIPIPDPTPNEPEPQAFPDTTRAEADAERQRYAHEMRSLMAGRDGNGSTADSDAAPTLSIPANCVLGAPDAPPPPPPRLEELRVAGWSPVVDEREAGTQVPTTGPSHAARAEDKEVPLRFVVGGNITEPVRVGGAQPEYPNAARIARVQGAVVLECTISRDGSVRETRVLRGLPLGLTEAAVDAARTWRFRPATLDGRPVEVLYVMTIRFSLGAGPAAAQPTGEEHATDTGPALRFLAERSAVDGLTPVVASGYWANTYVPGDPRLRHLRARFTGVGLDRLEALTRGPLRLHDSALPPAQPLDPSASAAMAVFLHADQAAVDGPTRLLVQVGLQGTPRHGGGRPAMNVGVVLDLRGAVPDATATALRALVLAAAAARDVGDRFTLVVAGHTGAAVVEPARFRHGPLSLLLRQLLEDGGGEGQGLGLTEALRTAVDRVGAGADPDAPLGASGILVVSPLPMGPELDRMLPVAAASALAGVPVSAVAVGDRAVPSELERLVLAGQGTRRVLTEPSAARELVDRELSAVGRVVARVARLRIRLAPGVQLVDVVGSERLDRLEADAVRRAERSVDLRLARNLGITADRGEDEEGIQIVIPSFYAGDAHVVLLDVVVPGPGPVADVTLRYKDLVHLRNGTARARLTLPRGTVAPGPLENNVTKNLLAHRLGDALQRAGDAVADGRLAKAGEELESMRSLLSGLRLRLPWAADDPDLATDRQLLAEYLRVLEHGPELEPGDRMLLADSLRLAGWRKLVPVSRVG